MAAEVVAGDTSLQYAHAVIGEAQDFHPAHLDGQTTRQRSCAYRKSRI